MIMPAAKISTLNLSNFSDCLKHSTFCLKVQIIQLMGGVIKDGLAGKLSDALGRLRLAMGKSAKIVGGVKPMGRLLLMYY